jgi:hypothetical protein
MRIGFTVLTGALAWGQSGAPDKFVEAAVYADFASAAMKCRDRANPNDPVRQAKTWTQKAIAAVSTFRSSDSEEQARATRFLNQEKTLLATLDRWERFLKDIQRSIQSALKSGKLETATKMVSGEGGPSCDPRMRRARLLVEEQRRLYTQALADADRWAAASNSSQAFEKYKAAAKLNREDFALQEKLREVTRK